ncbi:MAG: hypothetical protein ACLFOY_09005 [Desulfatibacillaceae bacterium]
MLVNKTMFRGIPATGTVLCLLAALQLFLPAPAAGDSQWVDARGTAPITVSCGPDTAKRIALHEAQRNAVEVVLGVMLSSETVTENFEVIEDRILTRVAGYVRNYELLREVPGDRDYEVDIKAEVEKTALADDVAALARILPRMNYPTLLVAISQKEMSGDNAQVVMAMETAQTTVGRALSKKGFRMAEASALAVEKLRQANLMEAMGDDVGKALEEASHNTQVVVAGQAVVQDNGPSPYSDKVHSYGAFLSAKVYATVTGNLLAAASAEANVPHHGFALGTQAAVEKASARLADKLADEIVKAWLDACYNDHDVQLVVEGVSFSSLKDVQEALGRDVQGVARVNRRAFLRDRAELVLGWNNCNTMRLAEMLDGLSCGKGTLAVLEVAGDTVRVEYAEPDGSM